MNQSAIFCQCFLWDCNKYTVCSIDCMAVPWASYQISKIAGCAWVGNAGNVFPATDFKGNHGTCVMHVPWCMSGSLTRGGGETLSKGHRVLWKIEICYLIRMTWLLVVSHPDDITNVIDSISSGWHYKQLSEKAYQLLKQNNCLQNQ